MTNAQSKIDDQYQQLCPNCDCVLHEGVGIYCLEHEDGEEAVLCSDCWDCLKEELKTEGWKCDEEEEDCPYCGEAGYWETQTKTKECCKFCEGCKTYKSRNLDGWSYDDDGDKCGKCNEKRK